MPASVFFRCHTRRRDKNLPAQLSVEGLKSFSGPKELRFSVQRSGDVVGDTFGRPGQIDVRRHRIPIDGVEPLVAHECSNYFILGKLDIADPVSLGAALDALRSKLLADPYFKRVPSMQPEQRKTALGFHAKDDIAEVRREVFRVLMEADVRFYAVVRSKADLVAYVKRQNEVDATYRYKGDQLYDTLVEELFRRYHPLADELNICFAKRGNRARTHAFRSAIEKAEARFESEYGLRRSAKVSIVASTPVESGGLQAVDYFLWALQRYYERKDERYAELIWPKVIEVHDLDGIEDGRKGVVYNKKRPLIIDQGASE